MQILEERLVAQEYYHARLAEDTKQARQIRVRIAAELDNVEDSLVGKNSHEVQRQLSQISELRGGLQGDYCEHRVVDALMAVKMKSCKEADIRTKINIAIPDDISLPSVDLCAVFSNLADNAIHGCEHVERLGRYIELKAQIENGYLVVEIMNSCIAVEAVPRAERLHRRKKFLLSEHGWGFIILEGIAKKYEGSLIVEQEENVFRTVILLKLN